MLRRANASHGSSFAARALAYTAAELSRIFCRIAPDEVERRRDACRSCEYLDRSGCTAPKIGYCTGCGCPHWRRSELSAKTTAPAATCPRGKWTAYQVRLPDQQR